MLTRFLELGLLERFVYEDDGTEVIQVTEHVPRSPSARSSVGTARRHRMTRAMYFAHEPSEYAFQVEPDRRAGIEMGRRK